MQKQKFHLNHLKSFYLFHCIAQELFHNQSQFENHNYLLIEILNIYDCKFHH